MCGVNVFRGRHGSRPRYAGGGVGGGAPLWAPHGDGGEAPPWTPDVGEGCAEVNARTEHTQPRWRGAA